MKNAIKGEKDSYCYYPSWGEANIVRLATIDISILYIIVITPSPKKNY